MEPLTELELQIRQFIRELGLAKARGKQDRRNTLNRLKRVCVREVDSLRNKHTTNTLSGYLTSYRKEAKAAGYTDLLRFLRITTTESRQMKHEALRSISKATKAFQSAAFIRTANSQLSLPMDFYNQKPKIGGWATALCALTGRRTIEVLKTGQFSHPERGHPLMKKRGISSVLFSGQAKTKNSENARTAPYRIPVLTTHPEDIISRINDLRSFLKIEGLDNVKVTRKYKQTLGDTTTKNYSALLPDERLSPKSLRALYAATCWKHTIDPDMAYESFIAEILGHTLLDSPAQGYSVPNDLQTALAYRDYRAI